MHEKLMQEAIRVAEEAYRKGHPPFGVVIVHNESVIGTGHNSVDRDNDPTAHSEMQAIREASRNRGHADLSGCDLYTILEPCPMCAAAIVWARIETVIIGSRNPVYGAAVSLQPTIFEQMKHVHQVNVVEGVLGDQCRELVSRMRHAAISDGGA